MIKWSVMRSQIWSGMLKDPSGQKYVEDTMDTWARWACEQISHHTAEAAVTQWEVDGTQSAFPLPDNMIDDIDKAGLVAVIDNDKIKYIKHFRAYPELVWPVESVTNRECYWEWPTHTLQLGFMPKTGSVVKLYYFKIWTPPVNDDDMLMFPMWMEPAFANYVAAGAMNPVATQAANIRQFNNKQDSGNPEHNPVLKQAEWFLSEANRLLKMRPPQDRANFYSHEGRY